MSLFDRFSRKKTTMCPVCGGDHGELPHVGSNTPFHWNDDYDSKDDCHLDSDLCIIEDRDFFIRGVIEVPIAKTNETFGWGVWVSLKRENFLTYRENSDSSTIGPFFGWLCTKIDYYAEDTLSLKTQVHFQGNNQRPKIVIAPTDHELFKNQNSGITKLKSWEIVHYYMDDLAPKVHDTNSQDPWKFDQSENVVAITDRQVLSQESPILVAIHYLEDESWAFVSGFSDAETDSKVVSMKTIVEIDKTIEEISSLPPGHVARRSHIGGKWVIERDESV